MIWLIYAFLMMQRVFIRVTQENINLVAFSAFLNDMVGQVFVMFVLTVAAAEVSIGLAILVVYNRLRGTIEVDDISQMKG